MTEWFMGIVPDSSREVDLEGPHPDARRMTRKQRATMRLCEWLHVPRCPVCKGKPIKRLAWHIESGEYRFSIACLDCKIKVTEKASTPFLARARAYEGWKTGPYRDMRANIARVHNVLLGGKAQNQGKG